MSKVDFNDHVYNPLTSQQIKKLQRLQLSTASFVLGRFARSPDLRTLNWLPILERREYNLLKLSFKAIHFNNWPAINKLKRKIYGRELRSNDLKLETSFVLGTFQDSASKCFNALPSELRNLTSYTQFCTKTKDYLLNRTF